MDTREPDASHHLLSAIRAAMDNVREHKAQPFGAVITRGDEVIATAVNKVEALCDPSAHAEMQAVRAAAKALGSTDLSGCTVYASGYPCPMCLTAMYLSGVEQVYYAYSSEDGAPYGLSAESGYRELARPVDERHMKLARAARARWGRRGSIRSLATHGVAKLIRRPQAPAARRAARRLPAA